MKHDHLSVLPVAMCIGIAHIVIGVCILVEPSAILVSSLAGFRWIASIYNSGDMLGGLLLIVAGALAVVGGYRSIDIALAMRFKLITPQVVLLVFTLASIIPTVVEGRYPDGYVPAGGTLFILADQGLAAAVSLFHVISVLLIPTSVAARLA